MQYRKRNNVLLIVLLISVLALSACSKSGENTSSASTTLTFWHGETGVTEEALEEIVESFEEEHPDIDVDLVYMASEGSGENEKLLTAVASGSPPDVTYFDRFAIGSWASEGALTPLTEYAEQSGIKRDMFYSVAWDEAVYEDELYGVPVTTDSRAVLYNKDHFEEVGLDPENPPATLEEFEKAADMLTIKDGNRFERVGFIPWHSQGRFMHYGWTFGGDFYDEDSGKVINPPENVEALQWIVDFTAKHNIEELVSFSQDSGGDAMDPFITEQLSMQISGPKTVATIEKYNPDLNYGAFPLPTPTGDDPTTWSGGWSLIIPKGASHEDEAWQLLEHFVSEESQLKFAEMTNDFSVIPEVNDEVGFAEDDVMGVYIDLLPVSHYRPVIPEGPLLYNSLNDAMEDAYRGNLEPQEALDKATDQVNKALGN